MTLEQIITDIGAGLAAVSAIATILAHLPFPAKYAEFFARLALYASNAKFSVNQRDTLPKPTTPPPPPVQLFPGDPPPPSWPGAAVLLLALGFALHSSACAPAKPPCDQAKLAAVVLLCTAQSQQCVSAGKSEAECSTLADCDSQIEKACGQ